MRIEVRAFDGCPNAQPAVRLAREVAAEAGADTEIEIVRINYLETAQTRRFVGSLSVRIGGADMELEADRRPPTYGCRIYQGGGGPTCVPDREWVVAAFREAAQSSKHRPRPTDAIR